MDSSTKTRSKNKAIGLPNSIFDSKLANDSELSSRQWNLFKEGFPPGMTVDELRQFRRKKPAFFNRPIDNLHVEEGSLKDLKTEYNRRFIAPSLDNLCSQRSSRPPESHNWQIDNNNGFINLKGEYNEKFMEFPRERPSMKKPDPNLKLPDSNKIPMDFTTEKIEKYVPFQVKEKAKSLRRNTALHLEGELLGESECKREYQHHGNVEKVPPIKRQSHLKIEGLFETLTSEQKEKYVAYLKSHRPPLAKRDTELKLLGDFEFATECSSKFSDPGCHPRAMLRKRSTSLKLEGETDFTAEYQKSFIDLPRERPTLIRPMGHLSSKGELDLATEFRSQYIQFPITPTHLPIKMQDNILINGDFSINPEYREKFISHGRSKSEIIRRRDNLTLGGEFSYETENNKYKYIPTLKKESTNLKEMNEKPQSNTFENPSSNNLKNYTEYHSQFLDFPRSRPSVQKPTTNLKGNGEVTADNRTQFRTYGATSKTSPRKRSENFNLKVEKLGEPEYKNKFIEFPLDSYKVTKPASTLPTNYPSFQVLDVNKPSTPPKSMVPTRVAEKPDNSRLSSPLNQPSYRLEVHNVDNKPQGFHRGPERVFPADAVVSRTFISSESKDAAFKAAMKRRQELETRLEASPSTPRQSKPYLDENGNTESFQILKNITQENSNWSPRIWNEPNGNCLTQTIVT